MEGNKKCTFPIPFPSTVRGSSLVISEREKREKSERNVGTQFLIRNLLPLTDYHSNLLDWWNITTVIMNNGMVKRPRL